MKFQKIKVTNRNAGDCRDCEGATETTVLQRKKNVSLSCLKGTKIKKF